MRPRRHPESSFRSIGDEGGLVVLAGRGEIKVLNPVAIRIYELLDGSRTPEQIAAAIVEEYDVAPDVALDQLREFLDTLERHGMLAAGESSE